jgi:phosphatidylglycerol---prolipoprotein diacylglyceryl transferase
MPPEGIPITIGSFHYVFAFYGFILMFGAVAGAWLASRSAKQRGHDPEIVWDLLVWLIIAGVVGARLWHILLPSKTSIYDTMHYLTHPIDAINVRNGGLGIPGAVIGGVIALYFYSRKHKLNFAEWADIAAPALALGQAIGRWGNFFNQELYGAPTNLPWAIYIEPLKRMAGFKDVEYFHPLFLYESIYNLANMFFLLWLGKRFKDRLKTGDIFLVYLVIYPIGRFFLDFLRLDIAVVGNINFNQTLMLIIAIAASAVLVWRHWPTKTEAIKE